MKEHAPRIHRLKITLKNVNPPIWRRLEVHSDWGIDCVADAIRGVFGWSFDHACKFIIKRRHYGTFNHWVRNDPEQEFETKKRQVMKSKLSPQAERQAMEGLFDYFTFLKTTEHDDDIASLFELAPRARTKFKFIFDFGDWWEHTVEVEKVEAGLPATLYPQCIGGAGANPLEDCGGWWNLNSIIEAVSHPDQPRNETIQQIITNWVGENWDYTHFSLEDANQRLRNMFRILSADSTE